MDLYNVSPIKVWGLVVLTLPVGFIAARSLGAQIDALYSKADNPETSRYESESLLRFIGKIYAGKYR
jgi:hypothetical protein